MRAAPWIVPWLVLFGCQERLPEDLRLPAPKLGEVAKPTPADERMLERVRLAALRHMIAHNGAGNQQPSFVCVVTGREDPSAALLKALGYASGVRVVPSSACEHSIDGVRLRHGDANGIEVYVGKIEIEGRHTVVRAGYFEAGLSASSNTLKMERLLDGSWQVSDDHVDWVS